MPEPNGDQLFVNLAAAEVRRRLKGFGHGVRKVHSAGRQRAVIIHTAAGKHLVELEAKFADVGCSSSEADPGRPLNDLTIAPRFVDDERRLQSGDGRSER